MAKRYHPLCPRCGAEMWRVKNGPIVKCSECGCRMHVTNPRLRLHRSSKLARLRKELVGTSPSGDPLKPLFYTRLIQVKV